MPVQQAYLSIERQIPNLGAVGSNPAGNTTMLGNALLRSTAVRRASLLPDRIVASAFRRSAARDVQFARDQAIRQRFDVHVGPVQRSDTRSAGAVDTSHR